MLHGVWLILKILLLLAAGLLGLVLLLLALVFFVPVHYRGHVRKDENFQAEGELSWLLRLVRLPVRYGEDGVSAKLRILCFTVKDLLAEEEPDPEKSEKATVEEKPEPEQALADRPVTVPSASVKPSQQEIKTDEVPEKKQPFWKRVRIFLLAGKVFLKRLAGKLRNLKYTIHRFCVKMKRMKKFVTDDRTKGAFSLAWAQVKHLLGKLRPKKMRGWICFGTGDPALTGELLGLAAVFYPLYGKGVQVTPDFQETLLRGELFVKGRVRLITLVRIAWKLFWDKNVRFVYDKFNG